MKGTSLTNTIVRIRLVGGSSNVSIPVKCRTKKPGIRVIRLKRPTKPKNITMSTRDSSPILFFINVVYMPYIIALENARTSPMAISLCDL